MTALVIVDVQNDFLPGGALGVKEGDKVVPVINKMMNKGFDLIVASKDWHPANHGSFADNHEGKKVGEFVVLDGIDQILWPVHCVQESDGSEFPEALDADKIERVIYKGTDASIDSYSAFFDNGHKKATDLDEVLKEAGIHTLYVAGIATDYCVKFTVLDALKLGYEVYLIEDACRGVNLDEGDSARAIEEMKQAGAHVVTTQDVSV